MAGNPQNATSSVEGRSLGIGLEGLTQYSTELPFLNHFKANSDWTTQNGFTWDTEESEKLDLDVDGWVKSLPDTNDAPKFDRVGTLLLREIPETFPSGKYVVTYDGEGTISYDFDATKIDNLSRSGRDVIQVDNASGGGVFIQITETDPNNTGNYIRNIEVHRQEDIPLVELGIKFNPVWLQKFKQFGSLRFMDWMRTNNSEQSQWSDRPQVSDFTWTEKGVPVEIMVELANETGMSPWFNMPHDATDDYVRKFATYVRDNLDPSLIASVEYSNEVWNWQFEQAQYALKKAAERWGADVGSGWVEFYGMRTAQVAKIWKDVFGAEKERVNAVIGVQTGYYDLAQYILETPQWVAEGNQPAWKYVDSLAITGYFSGELGRAENADTVRSWLDDPDGGFGKAFQQLRSGGLLPLDGYTLNETIENFSLYKTLTEQYGLDLVAYEGGSHVVAYDAIENDEQLVNFLTEVNRHPEMGKLYRDLLQAWKDAGGKEFNHFVDVSRSSKDGSWGALESLTQNGSPKYNAMTNFIANNDRWWDAPTPNATIGLYTRGKDGNETIDGSKDNDILLGGKGNDKITAGEGQDRLHGEEGNDTIDGGDGDDRIIGAAGNDFVYGGKGNDDLKGEDGDDRLYGRQGKDTLNGGKGKDIIIGGDGNDTLVGGDGNDILRGSGVENGKNTIDTLSGSNGKDLFILGNSTIVFYDDGNASNSGSNDYARITDFKSTEDLIRLKGDASNYRLGKSSPSDTAIYLDANTDELVAIVEGNNSLNLSGDYFTYI